MSASASKVRNGVRVSVDGKREERRGGGGNGRKGGRVRPIRFAHRENGARAEIHIGDCREILGELPAAREQKIDLIFADPPFNWNRAYDEWADAMPEEAYLEFTFAWLDACVRGLRGGGALWVNIPDDWAAEIVCYLKGRMSKKDGTRVGGGQQAVPMAMQNWCVWHYRFGQNTTSRFINSKVHALYFVKAGGEHTWNPTEVLELSDRAAIYGDKRTLSKKDGMPAGRRVPMDVWYGQYWGRVQGNSLERRHYHDNQLPEVYLERVVRACSRPGDLVVDPFLGSGTTGVVAHALGREFIGCEFSAENAKFAAERMKAGPVRKLGGEVRSSAIFEKRRSLEVGEELLSSEAAK